jgi:hypothetical protein
MPLSCPCIPCSINETLRTRGIDVVAHGGEWTKSDLYESLTLVLPRKCGLQLNEVFINALENNINTDLAESDDMKDWRVSIPYYGQCYCADGDNCVEPIRIEFHCIPVLLVSL